MKICCISDTTYVAAAPDDPSCTLYYGSESAHYTLCEALEKRGHQMLWYAPRGSSHTKTMEFHPLILTHGQSPLYDNFENVSLDGSKTSDIIDKKVDFVIDMSASAMVPFLLWKDYQYTNYCCYRNGYEAFGIWPPHIIPEKRNYVCPSMQNKRIFDEKSGYKQTKIARYGIPEFYSDGKDDEYFIYDLERKNYYLYPHRPTVEKGIQTVVKLAIDFPKEHFVIVNSAPINVHRQGIYDVQRLIEEKSLDNLHIVTIPLQPKHHYYKRELIRGAKAVLSPFDTTMYKEGFGLANAESISCGTPIIISDSESTRELWNSKEAAVCDNYDSFHMAIADFSTYSFSPSNRYKVEDYAKRYEQIISDIINNKDSLNEAEQLLSH